MKNIIFFLRVCKSNVNDEIYQNKCKQCVLFVLLRGQKNHQSELQAKQTAKPHVKKSIKLVEARTWKKNAQKWACFRT